MREALLPLVEQLRHTEERVARPRANDRRMAQEQCHEPKTGVDTGIGPITASAIVATITDARLFSSGGISLPGSGWSRDRTPAVARNGWAASQEG